MSDSGFDYLTPEDTQFMSDYANSPVNYYLPTIGGDNSFSSGSTDSSGFNVDQLGKALQYGVDAYGKIEAINRGGAAQYNTPPGTGIAPPAPTGNLPAPTGGGAPSTSSTFMQKLTDFSTPVPYAVGLAAMFGILMVVKVARR